MQKGGAAARFIERFRAILEDMDGINGGEALEEINAELEDAIFWMENIDEDEADAQEEMEGALEEMEDILAEYRKLQAKLPAIGQKTTELEMCLQMAKNNLR